jgi:predicted membrane channel-forming protein YqfA (hemolysin III family)
MLSHESRCGILALISAAAVAALLFVGPIPQDPNYHLFSDFRQISGVRNFWNVLSNLPFLLVGAVGLLRYSKLSHKESAQAYLVMCVGVVLVGFGSAYYHYAPSNDTLLWDRLPMTIAFMALLSLLLNERVIRSPQRYMLWIFVSAGAAAVFYWSWTESLGKGDLRPYALVQFLPVLLMPLMLAMFNQRYLSNKLLLGAFALYFAAKALEHFDAQILAATGLMSGHAIKHVAAAAAVLCIIYAVPTRPVSR